MEAQSCNYCMQEADTGGLLSVVMPGYIVSSMLLSKVLSQKINKIKHNKSTEIGTRNP